MRRRFWMTLLALGAVAGFGSELAHAHCHRWQERREAMMDAWARTCVNAAQRPAESTAPAPPPPTAAPPPAATTR